jgi:protein pelota
VLITDTLLTDAAVTRLVEKAEGMHSKIIVLSGTFEPGERLDALGGIAALLRYKVGG